LRVPPKVPMYATSSPSDGILGLTVDKFRKMGTLVRYDVCRQIVSMFLWYMVFISQSMKIMCVLWCCGCASGVVFTIM
jgi:hypothetical protein